MWTPSTWQSEEDVDRDIMLFNEHNSELVATQQAEVPDTILKYRKQMALNKRKPLNSDIDESVPYIVSGRGKGIRDRVIRPGGNVECHPLDDVELKKKIREVSGFGYSNKLIEETIGTSRGAKDCDSEEEKFKLVSVGRKTNGKK